MILLDTLGDAVRYLRLEERHEPTGGRKVREGRAFGWVSGFRSFWLLRSSEFEKNPPPSGISSPIIALARGGSIAELKKHTVCIRQVYVNVILMQVYVYSCHDSSHLAAFLFISSVQPSPLPLGIRPRHICTTVSILASSQTTPRRRLSTPVQVGPRRAWNPAKQQQQP